MRNRLLLVLFTAFSFAVGEGCAHLPAGKGESPENLLADACRPGESIRSVQGSIWMNVSSREAKGSFPASVEATAPGRVTLEVTNLLGGREALIRVNGGEYILEVPGKSGRSALHEEGAGSWGGIPLRWASELFLGRIPCPVHGEKSVQAGLRLQVSDSGDLMAEAGNERFVYHFRQWAGRPWPESLHWESLDRGKNTQMAVDFKFDNPEDKTGAPKKWEAKSVRGEVKVRWRDLQISS